MSSRRFTTLVCLQISKIPQKSVFTSVRGHITAVHRSSNSSDESININLLSSDGTSVKTLFQNLGFASCLPNKSSTSGGSQIDCCFANNCGRAKSWIYESYYSYHKPICFVWQRQ